MSKKVKIRKVKPMLRLFKKAAAECKKEVHDAQWNSILLHCTIGLHVVLGDSAISKLLDEVR